MPTVREVSEFLDRIVPFSLQESYDNAGLLIGRMDREVTSIIIALDITAEVIAEASETGAQLIVSHHPVIQGTKTILDSDVVGARVTAAISAGISAICMHTNLDTIEGGVNDTLMGALGIEVMGSVEAERIAPNGKMYGLGRYGTLERDMNMDEFLAHVKKSLDADGLRYYSSGRPVRKVGVCGGSGGEYMEAARDLGCDTYITADVKYSRFLDAKELNINLIDAGHFSTENTVIPVLSRWLRDEYPGVDVNISNRHGEIAMFYV